MASGMKVWLALCLGGLAVVAVLLLPPGSADFVRRDAWQLMPAQLEAKRLDGRASRLDWQIRLLRTADSLRFWLEEAHRDGETGLVRFPREMGERAEIREFRTVASARLEELREGGGDHDVLVAVVVLDSRWGSERGIPGSRADHTFAGTLEDGTPYCARVAWLDGRELHRLVAPWSGGPLGLCRFWARFGPPGPHVARWLEAGGHHRARSLERPAYLYEERDFLSMVPFGLEAAEYVGRQSSREMTARLKRCVTGSDGCAGLVLDTVPASSQPYTEVRELTDLVTGGGTVPDNLADRYLFAELEALEGEAALRTLWTSELPVTDAFAEAAGADAGTWVRAWIRSFEFDFLGRRGPSIGAVNAGLSLLTLLAAAGVGLTLQHRRQVS